MISASATHIFPLVTREVSEKSCYKQRAREDRAIACTCRGPVNGSLHRQPVPLTNRGATGR